ncbi:MAG: RluA family pseudouridine synthase [Oscillospiraceae bacterium]|nr:RluA family pseudouridine synthase [Oscillospiraceae bacterium]
MELNVIATRSGRLSTFLRQELGLSTGLMNKLKWSEKLYVNGIPRHADFSVSVGDVITADLDEPQPEYPAEDGEFTILYEDDHILVVDKPAGMLIHPSRSRLTGTLANRVIGYYRRTGQSCAFHPITRLDRDTFGIVLLAKNAHIHGILNQFHAEGKLQKTYHALVFGGPENKEGIIDAPIARRPLPSLLRYVNQEGKPSQTRYSLLEKNGNIAKLALQPITGRTHQLRVHCAYMGYPILGDPQYGSEASLAYSEKLGLSSQLLCAKRLSFPHPVTGSHMNLVSKLDV